MSTTEVVVNYLVNKKFGAGFVVMTTAFANFEKSKDSLNSKKFLQIEAYKKSLNDMPENELSELYKKSLAEEESLARQVAIYDESRRFYNLKTAQADFVHWSKAAHWTIDEATALSFGKEPDVVTWKAISEFKPVTPFIKNFIKRRELALRAACWKRFDGVLPPIGFLEWAEEIQIELPQQLVEEVSKIGGSAVNWHQMYLGLKVEFDRITSVELLPKQKPESTRKTENLLQALACIAIDEYGYVPALEKSTAPKEISEALSRQGKQVDPKTIRGWLKEGFELLPAKPYKD